MDVDRPVLTIKIVAIQPAVVKFHLLKNPFSWLLGSYAYSSTHPYWPPDVHYSSWFWYWFFRTVCETFIQHPYQPDLETTFYITQTVRAKTYLGLSFRLFLIFQTYFFNEFGIFFILMFLHGFFFHLYHRFYGNKQLVRKTVKTRHKNCQNFLQFWLLVTHTGVDPPTISGSRKNCVFKSFPVSNTPRFSLFILCLLLNWEFKISAFSSIFRAKLAKSIFGRLIPLVCSPIFSGSGSAYSDQARWLYRCLVLVEFFFAVFVKRF